MSFTPSEELKVTRYAYSAPGSQDISDLVQLPINELSEQEQASMGEEQEIYDQICALADKWEAQAKQTIRIQQAKQFLRTMRAPYTSNKWVTNEYHWQEISNMVYKMTYRISKGTTWRTPEKTIYWELSWSLVFNTPQNPDSDSYGRKIAGQSKKRFSDKPSLEKYLQGRIDAYAHLFTEISPPIPAEHQKCFCVNGALLPGYTVENPDTLKPDEAAVDKLLAFLGNDELGGAAPASTPQAKDPVPPACVPFKSVRPAAKKKSHSKNRGTVR